MNGISIKASLCKRDRDNGSIGEYDLEANIISNTSEKGVEEKSQNIYHTQENIII